MTEVRRAFSGARWESEVGYCRAIRKGGHIWVTGTVAVDDDVPRLRSVILRARRGARLRLSDTRSPNWEHP